MGTADITAHVDVITTYDSDRKLVCDLQLHMNTACMEKRTLQYLLCRVHRRDLCCPQRRVDGLCHGQMLLGAPGCDDHLEISFTIKDSNGKAVVTDTFNYDSNNTDGVWYTESGLSWFNSQMQ